MMDKKILAELAEKDEDESVREAAKKRLEAFCKKITLRPDPVGVTTRQQPF